MKTALCRDIKRSKARIHLRVQRPASALTLLKIDRNRGVPNDELGGRGRLPALAVELSALEQRTSPELKADEHLLLRARVNGRCLLTRAAAIFQPPRAAIRRQLVFTGRSVCRHRFLEAPASAH